MNPDKRERVNFVLKDPEQLDAIRTMLDPENKLRLDRAEVIRNALNFYASVVREASRGSRVYVGPEPDQLKLQLEVPGLQRR